MNGLFCDSDYHELCLKTFLMASFPSVISNNTPTMSKSCQSPKATCFMFVLSGQLIIHSCCITLQSGYACSKVIMEMGGLLVSW